jgi:glycosyltransferase involved in cell wall biosynthesis
MTETLYTNNLPTEKGLALSVVTPFHKNDPSLLLSILTRQCIGQSVELIIVDDGSKDEALTSKVKAYVAGFPTAAKLITFETNQGRSAARNRLIGDAKAPYILFLDSDMAPDSDLFISDWLALIEGFQPEIAYGGFTTAQVPDLPHLKLARALAQSGDCHGADVRATRGPLAVATSNLLVRADIMQQVRFDSGFVGWGWEDVDWALRAAQAGFVISHVPIPATHMGLDEPAVLMEKFAKAGPNFRLIVERHPQMQSTQGTRLAKLLAHFPFQNWLQKLLYKVALADTMPIRVRSLAARAWRALWASFKDEVNLNAKPNS